MMGLVFKCLSVLYNFYPVKIFLNKRIERYFLNYHIAQILQESSDIYVIATYCRLSDLKDKSPLRGVLCEYLRVGDFYPTPKDLAVAINVSINAYCNQKFVNESSIIDLAFHLSHEIKRRLFEDPLLKKVCDDFGKDISIYSSSGNRMEIEQLFADKKNLFISYFSTFEKLEFSYSVKVWHQSQENSFIEWKEQDAINVHLNPMRIREGFFLMGFDYHCNQSNRGLRLATRSNDYETFNGDSNGKIIWAY
ncbi:hypothetical protein ACSWSC_000175 [Vibrio alginolyticus]